MMNQQYKKRYVLFIYAAMALLTLFAYEPMRHNGFINLDDRLYLTENSNVNKGISPESIVWAFTTLHIDTSCWHPLTWLSHILDCELFGLNALGHHLTSLLFHISNTMLLFLVLKKTTSKIWPSAFVAAAFALHPLHVESVAWISERKDVLSSFFWILTMLAYVRYVERPSIRRYLLTVLAFCLGLLSKPMMVTLPFALLLLDYWPLGRFQLGYAGKSIKQRNHVGSWWSVVCHLVWEKLPFFILSAILSVITFISQRSGEAVMSTDRFPIIFRVANVVVSYSRYIGKMFWPSKLAVFYPYPGENIPMWQVKISTLILLVVTIFVIYMARKHKYLLMGWFWYLGILVPVIGLVQVGTQAMADRYTYLPSIGIFIMVTWGIFELGAKWRFGRIWLGISMAIVLTTLLICTRMQVRYWKNSFTLYGHTLGVTRNNCKMQNSYGHLLYQNGDLDKALTHFKEALRIDPSYSIAYHNIGLVLSRQGKVNEAIACFSEALRIDPELYQAHAQLGLAFLSQGKTKEAAENFEAALRLRPGNSFVLNQLGLLLETQGKNGEAIESFNKAIRSDLNYLSSCCNAAKLIIRQKEYLQAIKYYEDALKRKPDWPEVCSELGEVYSSLGKKNEAVFYWRKALELDPDDVRTLNNLAWVLATTEDAKLRNPVDAVKYAKRISELVRPYQKPDFLDSLAAAYAAAGNFPEAIKAAEQAIELAEAAGKTSLADEIRQRLELYKSGQPYIQR